MVSKSKLVVKSKVCLKFGSWLAYLSDIDGLGPLAARQNDHLGPCGDPADPACVEIPPQGRLATALPTDHYRLTEPCSGA